MALLFELPTSRGVPKETAGNRDVVVAIDVGSMTVVDSSVTRIAVVVQGHHCVRRRRL